MKKTSFTHQKTKGIAGRVKLRAILILTLAAVLGFLNVAAAQRGNFSDWNVPPPLPPDAITKGNITGRDAKLGGVLLAFADVPPVSLPIGPPVRVPDLDAVSKIAPFADAPAQPSLFGNGVELTDLPLPDAPDAPAPPQQSVQDKPFQTVVDLPVPAAPEMPPFPAEPKSSGQTNGLKLPIPIMPDLVNTPFPSMPSAETFIIWSTPEIPESVGVEMVLPKLEKPIKNRGKGKHRVKSQSPKN
jgi:hypothetical protein